MIELHPSLPAKLSARGVGSTRSALLHFSILLCYSLYPCRTLSCPPSRNYGRSGASLLPLLVHRRRWLQLDRTRGRTIYIFPSVSLLRYSSPPPPGGLSFARSAQVASSRSLGRPSLSLNPLNSGYHTSGGSSCSYTGPFAEKYYPIARGFSVVSPLQRESGGW